MPFAETWNLEEVTTVREMFLAGKKDNEIAVVIGRSAAAVKHLRHTHDITLTYFQGDDLKVRNLQRACRDHLIDLKREYAVSPDEPIGAAKARYRERNELDVDPGYVNVTHSFNPYHVSRSYVGSQFAD